MRKYLLLAIFNIIVFFPSFGKYTPVDNEQELLRKLNLPGKYFTIIRFQDNRQFASNKPYDYNFKNEDTIIVSKYDTINDALNLSKRKIPYKLDLSQTIFLEPVNFTETTFGNDAFFSYCIFNKNVVFSEATFSKTAFFWNVHFNQQVQFWQTSFKKYTDFSNSIFSNKTCFDYSEFHDKTFFIKVMFMGFTSFIHSQFNDSTEIKFSEFKENVWFWDMVSSKYMSYYETIFNKSADFIDSRFEGNLTLTRSKHFGETRFTYAIMPDSIDLSFMELINIIDFTDIYDTITSRITYLNLYQTPIKKVIPNIKFQLWFPKDIINDKKNEIYKKLLNSLKETNYDDLHEKFDLDYQKFYYLDFKQEPFRYWFKKFWWNFGYNKEKIFLNTLILILIYSILVLIFLKNLLCKTYGFLPSLVERYKKNTQKRKLYKIFSNYKIALLYTFFLFFGLKISFDKIKFDNYYSVCFIILIYASGLICAAFMFNLIISL